MQGNAVLVEPLAALLSCVYRLTSTAQRTQAAVPPPGPGSLEASENWMGPGVDEQQEQTTTDKLKVCVVPDELFLLICIDSSWPSLAVRQAGCLEDVEPLYEFHGLVSRGPVWRICRPFHLCWCCVLDCRRASTAFVYAWASASWTTLSCPVLQT
jgi:hypothetical protein